MENVGWKSGRGDSGECFFFFQAEDGIRDYKVTGVQTCALPIWWFQWFSVWELKVPMVPYLEMGGSHVFLFRNWRFQRFPI